MAQNQKLKKMIKEANDKAEKNIIQTNENFHKQIEIKKKILKKKSNN